MTRLAPIVLAAVLLARPAEAAREDVVPVEPFAPENTAPAGQGETSSFAAPAEGNTRSAPLMEADASEKFSLWDFLSQFLSLRPPGDPNHPDKLRLTIGTSIGYDTNVLTTDTDAIASATYGLNGALSYNFGTERLKISSNLSLGALYYDNRPGDSTDFNGNFSGAITYSVNRRLQLGGNLSVSYLSQPNPTVIGGVSRFSGDYSVINGGISLSYSLRPRLSVRLEFRENLLQYADEAQNESLGFSDQSYIIGLDYLLTPRITLTTEYRYNPLSYYEADQNSTGQIFTVGFVASINPRLKWTLQAGVEGRSFEDSNQDQTGGPSTYFGPFLESNLEYTFAPGSSLLGSLRYGTEPSGVASLSIRETLRASFALKYAFTPRLTGDLGVFYQHDNYDQPGETNDFAQVYYTGSLGLTFQINPALSLNARYEYSAVEADVESNNYTRSVTTLGLQVIF